MQWIATLFGLVRQLAYGAFPESIMTSRMIDSLRIMCNVKRFGSWNPQNISSMPVVSI